MPEFRFVVESPRGRVRKGRITHDSERLARKQLESAGFTVVELVDESAIPSPESTGTALPDLVDRLPDIDALSENVTVKARNTVLVGIVLLGLAVAYFFRAGASTTRVSDPATAASTPGAVAFTFSGQVENQSSQQVQVILHLPEIPYSFSVPDLDSLNGGAFKVERKFQVQNPPSDSICEIWSLQNGKTHKLLKTEKASLSGESFDFGKLLVQ